MSPPVTLLPVIAVKSRVKAELDRLTERDVITPVNEPADWTSRMMVASRKSGDLGICLDLCLSNMAQKRERCSRPVMENILPKLANANCFSKPDLSSAYWHVHLDEGCSLLNAFQIQFGRYQWKRLPFGTSVSSGLSQKRLDIAVQGLDGVMGVSDDVIVYSTEDYDRNLSALLQDVDQWG